MTSDNLSNREQFEELLALFAVEWLSPAQREKLQMLLSESPAVFEGLFADAVAALDLSFAEIQPESQLPPHLMESLIQQGEAIVAGQNCTREGHASRHKW